MNKLSVFIVMIFGLLFSGLASAALPVCTAASLVGTYVGQTAPQLTNPGSGAANVVYDNAVFSFRILSNGVDKVNVLLQGSINGADVPDFVVADVPYTFNSVNCQYTFEFTAPNFLKNNPSQPDTITVNYRGNLRARAVPTGVAQGSAGRINVPEWSTTFPLGFARMAYLTSP